MNTAPKLHEQIKASLEMAWTYGLGEREFPFEKEAIRLAALAPPSGEGVEVDLQRDLDWLAANEGGTSNLCFMAEALNAEGQRGRAQSVHAANAFIDKQEQVIRTLLAMLSVRDDTKALAHFTEYFVRNYPGPNTVICDPKWHAPKIFRAAKYALTMSGYTTPQSAPVDGDWRKFYSVEVKSDPPFPYGVAVITDANGEQSVHVHDDNPVLWHLLNKLTTPPPASQERGDTTFRTGWRFDPGSVHAVPDFASSDMARQQREQYLNSPEGLQWRQTVALEKLAASPPSSAAADVTAGGTSTSDDELPGMWSPSDLTGGATDAAEQAKPDEDDLWRCSCGWVGANKVHDCLPEEAEQAQAGELEGNLDCWLDDLSNVYQLKSGSDIKDADYQRLIRVLHQLDALRSRLAGGVTVDDDMVMRAIEAHEAFEGPTNHGQRMRAALSAALGAK